jgi:hypothetical protein
MYSELEYRHYSHFYHYHSGKKEKKDKWFMISCYGKNKEIKGSHLCPSVIASHSLSAIPKAAVTPSVGYLHACAPDRFSAQQLWQAGEGPSS